MNVKKILQFFAILNLQNKIRFGRYILFTTLFRLTGRRFIKKSRFCINGITYEIDVGRGELNTIYETNILKDYAQINGFTPKSNTVCIDIGANIGSTALIWNRTIGNGSIYAIEPHPDTYKNLLKNININAAMRTIFPRQLAIGLTDGEMALFVTEYGTMALKPGRYKWPGKELNVRTMTLDSFVEKEGINHIDLLKIDIEGFEVHALQGAKNILRRTDRVVMEYHSDKLYRQCQKILSENGFEIEKRNKLLFCTKGITAGR